MRSDKEKSILLDEAVDLYTDLIDSGLFKVTSSRPLTLYDTMSVIKVKLSKSLNLYMIYDDESIIVNLGSVDFPCKLFAIEIDMKFYSYVSKKDQLKEHLISTLNWWSEHQYDTWGCDHNTYDDVPGFIQTAMKLWTDTQGEYNPYKWEWLN